MGPRQKLISLEDLIPSFGHLLAKALANGRVVTDAAMSDHAPEPVADAGEDFETLPGPWRCEESLGLLMMLVHRNLRSLGKLMDEGTDGHCLEELLGRD
jgi:hypothetical protein